jgi:hypothetical protein
MWVFTEGLLIALLLPGVLLCHRTVNREEARMKQLARWMQQLAVISEHPKTPLYTNVPSKLLQRYGSDKFCEEHHAFFREAVVRAMTITGCKEHRMMVCPVHYRKAMGAYLQSLCDRSPGDDGKTRYVY